MVLEDQRWMPVDGCVSIRRPLNVPNGTGSLVPCPFLRHPGCTSMISLMAQPCGTIALQTSFSNFPAWGE